ncbi:hypothetical protein [Fulvivirga ligni]|uniref:hypothetical protein n=1 Tax=Fulvivirga ligni TaxID=2904246 RepID=UPI001F30909D|nr:hypothetical protein [Fulvivirga ligni]UII21449.1 hypothetical protein LVD16_26840 [Fulvivirga ligni]
MPRQVLIYASGVAGILWGFALLLLSKTLQYWDPYGMISSAEAGIRSFVQINEPYAYTLAASFLIPAILTEFINFLFRKREDYQVYLAIRKEGDEFQRLLLQEFIKRRPMLFTLTTQKVYVGGLTRMGDPHGEDGFINIIPLFSGYRNAEGKLDLTTNYPRDENDNFEIVLPIDKIISASSFNYETYKKLNEGKEQSSIFKKIFK